MMHILFPFIMIVVMGGIHLYFYKRVVKRLHFRQKNLHILKWLVIINLIGIFGYLSGRYFIGVPNFLYFLFSLSLGVGFCFFILAFLYEIIHYLIHFIPFDKSKRAFIKKAVILQLLHLVELTLELECMKEQKNHILYQ